MLNGLDLFSGMGGIAVALAPWVRPVAYCEIDRYAQAVLLSRMAGGNLPTAPIWDDVQSLRRGMLRSIDIISGGFPCQDISVAGNGAGLAGERSSLFFEIARLTGELRPAFVFLENVPAITSRGGRDVVGAFAALGYDCRWCVISAASVGANHKRERWFLLAHTDRKQHENGAQEIRRTSSTELLANAEIIRRPSRNKDGNRIHTPACSIETGEFTGGIGRIDALANACGTGWEKLHLASQPEGTGFGAGGIDPIWRADWWAVEPDVGRVAHGVPCRVDRIKGLGNAVVPLQARTAFEILSGLRR